MEKGTNTKILKKHSKSYSYEVDSNDEYNDEELIETKVGGGQPLLTLQAHIFHINPETKKTWLPITDSSVPISFFFDGTRGTYRIVSVDHTKAIVNSIMKPGMTFTKTSQKFGQWTDIKSNSVYGLGFNSEQDLDKFQEQFNEIKDTLNLTILSPQRHLLHSNNINNRQHNPPSAVILPSPNLNRSEGEICTNNAKTTCETTNTGSGTLPHPVVPLPPPPSSGTDVNANSIYSLRRTAVTNCTNGNGSIQASPCKVKVDSPKRVLGSTGYQQRRNVSVGINSEVDDGKTDTPETVQLKIENEKLRHALQQSSANSKLWEIELSNLKQSNNRLTSTLQECAASVEEWKCQLENYKRENQRLKEQIVGAELITSKINGKTLIPNVGNIHMNGINQNPLIDSIVTSSPMNSSNSVSNNESELLFEQIELLRKRSDTLHKQLEIKQEEVAKLKEELKENECSVAARTGINRSLQSQEDRNRLLLEINNRLSSKLEEINDIQHKMSSIIKCPSNQQRS